MDICKYLESKVADADILVGLVIDGFGTDEHSDSNITMIECFFSFTQYFSFSICSVSIGSGCDRCDQ